MGVFAFKAHVGQGPVKVTLGEKRDLSFGPKSKVLVHVEFGDTSRRPHTTLLDKRRGIVSFDRVSGPSFPGFKISGFMMELYGNDIICSRLAAMIGLVDKGRPFLQSLIRRE